MSKRKQTLRFTDLLSPRLFRALGDPSRVAILGRLAERGGSCSVGEMAACCPVDLSVVSRHLATLRDAGVLQAVRSGKNVHYSLRTTALVEGLRALADAIEACCPPESACCSPAPPIRRNNREKTR